LLAMLIVSVKPAFVPLVLMSLSSVSSA